MNLPSPHLPGSDAYHRWYGDRYCAPCDTWIGGVPKAKRCRYCGGRLR